MSWDHARRAKSRKPLFVSPLLTKAAIARAYGVSPRTIGRLIASGHLTPIRVGKVERIAQADWDRYIQRSASTH